MHTPHRADIGQQSAAAVWLSICTCIGRLLARLLAHVRACLPALHASQPSTDTKVCWGIVALGSYQLLSLHAQTCPRPLDKVKVLKEMIFPLCEKLGQTIVFVRTKDSARSLHQAAWPLCYWFAIRNQAGSAGLCRPAIGVMKSAASRSHIGFQCIDSALKPGIKGSTLTRAAVSHHHMCIFNTVASDSSLFTCSACSCSDWQ